MLKMPIAILIAVVTLLGGFYGGYKLGQNGTTASAAAPTTAASGTRSGGFGGGLAALCTVPTPSASGTTPARGRGTAGTISFLGTGTLTVHNAACNTDTRVTFDPTVVIHKTVVGQVSDLQENQNVTIVGQRQADGSIKATSISLVPAGSGGRFGLGNGAGGTTTGGGTGTSG